MTRYDRRYARRTLRNQVSGEALLGIGLIAAAASGFLAMPWFWPMLIGAQ